MILSLTILRNPVLSTPSSDPVHWSSVLVAPGPKSVPKLSLTDPTNLSNNPEPVVTESLASRSSEFDASVNAVSWNFIIPEKSVY